MSDREAVRAVHRDLGVVSAVREAHHHQADSLYWLDMLLQDLRYGVRTLGRSPRFSVAVVLVLGLGVAMTTTVFAIVDSLLLNAVPGPRFWILLRSRRLLRPPARPRGLAGLPGQAIP